MTPTDIQRRPFWMSLRSANAAMELFDHCFHEKMQTRFATSEHHVPKLISPLVKEWLEEPTHDWYKDAALHAIGRHHYQVIHTRDGKGLYLLRCWLTRPQKESPRPEFGSQWESGNSVLLHYFARGDDDQSLHDHPWDFTTRILAGGYVEHLPPESWLAPLRWDGCPLGEPGPDWEAVLRPRGVGETIAHAAEDLHCVGKTEPGTWTMVTTGPRRREWGFHPPGKPWVGYREYLGLPAVTVPQSRK